MVFLNKAQFLKIGQVQNGKFSAFALENDRELIQTVLKMSQVQNGKLSTFALGDDEGSS